MYTQRNWVKIFTELGALWIHDKNPKHPHALLASGMHSSGFFNITKIIRKPTVLHEACGELSEKISHRLTCPPQVVICSSLKSITVAHECAVRFASNMAFTQKDKEYEGVMRLKQFSIKEGTTVIVIEDVITTGWTTRKTIKELECENKLIVLSIIGTLVNHSESDTFGVNKNKRKIVSLVKHPMKTWKALDCPLCNSGSEALRPEESWRRLTNFS